MLPHSSCTMAAQRRICAPVECCVQPSACMMVAARPATAVDANFSHTRKNFAMGVPQALSTFSGVQPA